MAIIIECENVSIEPNGTVVIVECDNVSNINSTSVRTILNHLEIDDIVDNITDHDDLISSLNEHPEINLADWVSDDKIVEECEALIPQIIDRYYDTIVEAIRERDKKTNTPILKILRNMVTNE